MPWWGWLLIGLGSVAALCAIVWTVVWAMIGLRAAKGIRDGFGGR